MTLDRFERQALQRLRRRSERAQIQAWPDPAEKTELVQRAGYARQRALAKLPDYLAMLEQNTAATGITVHWTESAQAANRIAIELIKKAGGRALRNHSPLLDEIAIDRAAIANEVELVRVHPGDQLVQLSGRPLQHPIWPTAHIRIADISSTLQEAWHVPPSVDPDILASTVRNRLRPELLDATTAVVGLNFAVAETGSLICLDNEGHNASLATYARTLICLLSIEQVVADAADLDILIEAFSRSAWGRPLPGFISEIRSPARTPKGEMQAIHLILVDNNRSDALAQGFGEALRCIQCGACHSVCPVFLQVGGAYTQDASTPQPYSGPIGAVLNPILLKSGNAARQPYLSTDCGFCASVCPVAIDLPGLLQRQRQAQSSTASWREKLAFSLWRRLLNQPRLFKAYMRLWRRVRH
ncbi:MAG: lactate utilization protein [Caldilineales bacterium]|nr:lactate utilization protein [Caldilineales bacterium]